MFKKILSLPTWLLCAGFAVFYAFLAYFCLQLSFQGTNASPVWPLSGLSFVLIWYLGYRLWPAVWLGAFSANVIVFLQHGWTPLSAVLVSALIGLGNGLEAVSAVFLLQAFIEPAVVLSRIRDIFKFFFAALVAASCSATIGTSSVYFSHPPGLPFDMVWFTWWLGDVVGILVIAACFLTYQPKFWQLRSWRNGLEAVLVCLILSIVNTGVFMGRFPQYGFYSHVTYLVLPFAIWATYRFGFAGANMSVLITAAISVMGSIFHLGPFLAMGLQADLVIVQCFLSVISVTVLSLAAALYERQKAEEGVKNSEARFRSLVENSYEVIALVDAQARVVYSSPSSKYILGYDLPELMGRSMFEFMHPEDILRIRETFEGLLKTKGAIAHATCRMKRKDGVWRWMEGSGHNLLHDPSIESIVINYRDITERKLSQEHFEQVVEYSPVAKVIFNREGNIRLANRSVQVLTGYTREELFNMNIESLIPEQFRRDHHPLKQRLDARTMGEGREVSILKKDGRQVPVEIGLTLIETEDGLCVLATMLDITQRKKAEEILRRDNESLERLVDERSKELIKTQKELKQFSRLADIGTLAATVAHELRNPLGVIHLAAYNLKKEKTDLNANRHLTNIEKKVWEGNQIIDNLLSYARIKIPNYEKVALNGILDECVSTVAGRFAEKGIQVEKHYTEKLVLDADSNQIREIFLNILNNACQSYTQAGGKVIVRAERQDDTVRVSVEDHGTGIAAEDLDKIFEPFFTRKSKGTGLGLTICNELVNMHQGKIEINSQLGQGTTVAVLLPVEKRNHAETASD